MTYLAMGMNHDLWSSQPHVKSIITVLYVNIFVNVESQNRSGMQNAKTLVCLVFLRMHSTTPKYCGFTAPMDK